MFAITGTINPALVSALETPKLGDFLVLTKPLGTGVLAFAAQIGRCQTAGLAQAAESMAMLNRTASEAMLLANASACTDITGFGLFSHLHRMLRGASAEVWLDTLPTFEGVMQLLNEQVIPGAIERNREYVGPYLRSEPNANLAQINLGLDAQTSGGLLIAVAQNDLNSFLAHLAEKTVRGVVIGKVTEGEAGTIRLLSSNNHSLATNSHGNQKLAPMNQPCCHPAGASAEDGSDPATAFNALLRAVQAPGAIDAKTKELILFALVLQTRCEPCCEAHLKKAKAMGITIAELNEAAWCAITMGGAPVKAFWDQHNNREPSFNKALE